jgi:tetratricopeptide (TPR) repeat protein
MKKPSNWGVQAIRVGTRITSTWLVIAALTMMTLCLAGCAKNPAKVKAKAVAAAEKYVQQARWEDAIIEYKNALKADPKADDVYFKIGLVYLKVAQYREAYLAFREAVDLNPADTLAQIALGTLYLEAGSNDDALQTATELVQRDPNSTDAQLLLANAYAGKKMMTQAIDVLHELLKAQPKLAVAHMNLGIFYAAQNKWELAKEELQKAVALDPGSLNTRKALGALYLTKGNAVAAEEQYRAALEANPKSPQALTTMAEFLGLEHRQGEAEQIYKQLVSLENNSAESRRVLATFYIGQSRFDEARAIDEQIAKDTPAFVPARVQLVELALNASDLAKAETLLTPLARDYGKNVDVIVLRARVLMSRQKPQQAIEVLEPALTQGNSAMIHYLLGAAYRQQGNLQRAQSEMESAIGANFRFVDAHIALAEMMLNRGQSRAALQYAKQALELAPGRSECLALLGSAYANLNDFANAEKYLQAYANVQPAPGDGLIRLGQLSTMQKKYPEAAAYFEKTLAANPQRYDALDGLATTLLLKGDKAGAMQRVKDALAHNPTPEALNVAGKVFAAAGDKQAAEDALRKALVAAPQNYASYVLLGSLYANQQQANQAITNYETALQLKRTDMGLWTMLGVLYQQVGNIQKAQSAYIQALDIEPNAGVAANNLAWIYADNLGDIDKALELARRAKVALPNVANVSDTLGWIYTKRQLNEMAVPLLQEAVKAEPKQAGYHLHLAVALMHSGRKVQARNELAAALKLNSGLRQRDEAKEIASAN